MNGNIGKCDANVALQVPTATVLTLPADLMQPLYCKLCSVSLNSPQQAQAHYQGKSHAKKVRQYLQKQGQVILQVHLQSQQKQENSPEASPVEENNTSPHQNGVNKQQEMTETEPVSLSSNNNTTNSVMHTKLASSDDFCKICGVSFNSPTQAQSHYQGKNHAKKQKSLQAPANNTTEESTVPKATKKLICFVCNLTLNSEAQLESHVKSYKHQQKVLHEQRAQKTLQGRWAARNGANTLLPNPGLGNGTHARIGLLPQNGHPNQHRMYPSMQALGLSPPMAKKPSPRPKDLAMVMTPSGKFYCACCDLMLNSEVQYRQHIQSKKHRGRQSGYKKPDLQ
ncbi:zinc finger matrin-type protein 3-like [Ptychodera flava]|uniref:zinc finger matrin-type protein 3-like n=1 Tax=Ptychodera flava TaxID=63121 RepID=UPI003969EBAE